MASGSPGETFDPAGSEGPSAEVVCQGGRACNGLAQVDQVAGGLASYGSPEEDHLSPGGNLDGNHQDVSFWGPGA